MSATTNDSSPEAPWSIQKLSELLGGYVERLGPVWVEAEITQWGQSAGNIYGKLSDIEADARSPSPFGGAPKRTSLKA